MDDESFELIRKQFKDRKLDLVIDYEHQTLSDVQAPAGGWIKDLYKGEDAIIAKVEWTPKAAEYLKNKEYRYNLVSRTGIDESDREKTFLNRYNAAIKFLLDVAKGIISIGVEEKGGSSEAANGFKMKSSGRVFSRDSMRGW